MSTGNIRRGQLVTPFGVGAMSVLVNGTSVITAGLDHWYEGEARTEIDMSEYTANDWRLEARLRVQEFRLPPDFRASAGVGPNRNIKLTVPVLRFPRWSFCMYCKRLERSTLTMRRPVECPDPKCAERRRKPRMSQVPFVAICPRGHLDDFPFDKWVHHSHRPTCAGPLRLESRGGGSLGGQVVVCQGCSKERSLLGITDSRRDAAGLERTTLTDRLAENDPYYCDGAAPWLARESGMCGEPIRGALRAAGNVYFPKVESSIYLPKQLGAVSAEMHEILRRPTISPVLKILRANGQALTAPGMRDALAHVESLLAPFSDEELIAGYEDMFGVGSPAPKAVDDEHAEVLTGDAEWRFDEYALLRQTPRDDYLTATDPGVPDDLSSLLDRVRRVEVLRETRVLRGFTRVRDGALRLSDGKGLLRQTSLPPARDWLPAYVVKGEGIYLELDADRLATWEQRPEVADRANVIADRYGEVARLRGLENRNLSPRFVLIHTLAHLLINELVFSCGYSSASLRERLYVSEEASSRMGGVLIYTAAGDSEGTMGGLVRMGRPDNLRSIFIDAINDAQWCSTDPVCMDMGVQGTQSCNLAACHGCTLLPETSCEEFNRFLDRGLVIGTFDDPTLGYFSGWTRSAT